MVPVLGGEVEEGEQSLAIAPRRATALVVLAPYLSANASIAASAAARRRVDLTRSAFMLTWTADDSRELFLWRCEV